MTKSSLYIIFASISLIALTSCKSNTAFTRSMYGLTTKYNILFNGKEAYKQGLEKMEQADNDDYTRLLAPHPVYRLVGQKEVAANADFDRAIDKCKKAVQTRSITNKPKRKENPSQKEKEWLTHGEWNPYIHNAWLLDGKAQFYKGDFLASAATFSYTARHFWWKPMVIAECHIWVARCHAVQGYTYEAEAELNLVVPQKKYTDQKSLSQLPEYQKLPKQLQYEFSLAMAEILLQRGDDGGTIVNYLRQANKGWQTAEQKARTLFLIAQLEENRGNNAGAYQAYGEVIAKAKNYKTQFNARIAQTRVLQSASLEKTEKKLKTYRRQKRNAEYLDQIYYALGNVALLRGDTTAAIGLFEQALEKSTRNGMDKAVAALRMGEVSFAQGDYVKAQKAYATALGIIKSDYPKYKDIARLSGVLDELQSHAETVALQDSLLHLASLPESEIIRIIDRKIKELIKAEKEAMEQEALADYNERVSDEADPLANNEQQPIVGEKDDSWYFYNKAMVNAGKNEFQRIWGSRRPEDNWRRKNKTEVALNFDSDAEENGHTPATDEAAVQEERAASDSASIIDTKAIGDPHQREYYLAQIPFTEADKDNANSLIEEGLYNMGVIINEKLENLPLAIQTFEQLEQRYPQTSHRLDMYYAIYLMYMRMKQNSKAEIYRQKLMHSFPASAYAVAVSDPNYIDNLRQMAQKEDSLYIASYNAYHANESHKVHDNYKWVQEHWPLSKLMPKFLFLDALSYVQEGDTESFREALERLTATYPSSDVSPLASQMVKGIHEGRYVQAGTMVKSMMWNNSLLQDGATADSSMMFIDDDEIPQLLLLAYKTDSISQNDLLFEIAKFNFENYLVKDFDLEIITTGDLSVLVISKFDNLDALLDYHDRMDRSTSLIIPEGIYMIDISEANFRALLSGRTFDDYFQWAKETYGI